ncbi:Zn-dependent hydrolase [Castellaniella sp.]|uniref:Zn-dependent hydrolase n=1 Tax=Castellaniella sp. TaxID=1955812 RepID=UPI003C7517DB
MSAAQQDLKIDGRRLWDSLMALARIGATPAGGVNRQALTDADRQARAQFTQWCEAAGCRVRTDAIGNLIARLPGQNDDLPAVMMGSHLDSQPTGGKFDGAYGVMAGLEVLRAIRESGRIPPRAVELAAWTNEEGTRFAPSMMGSAVYAGLLPLEEALAVVDADGVTVAEALRQAGVSPSGEDPGLPMAYFEAHIEQGPVLEAEGKPIGVVTAAQGQCWFRVSFQGQAAHAGSTPMNMRADALAAAARVVTALNEIGKAHAPGCATAGRMVVTPNSPNVIPGSVVLSAEMRHPDDAVRSAMESLFHEAVAAAAREHSVQVRTDKILEQPAAPFAAACMQAIRHSARQRQYPCLDIVSGAAHDAVALSRIVPSGMIFVPCAGGISHNEAESAEPDDLAAGCQVLCDSVLAFCHGDAAGR